MRTAIISILLSLATQIIAVTTQAKIKTKPLQIKVKLIDSTGGKWTTEGAFAFHFSEMYSIDLQFGTLCIEKGRTQKICKGASIKPDASVSATFSATALTKLGFANKEAVLLALQQTHTRIYIQIGRKRYPVLSLWPEPKKSSLRGLAVKGVPDKVVRLLRVPITAQLVYYQLSHMYQKRQDKKATFDYVLLGQSKPNPGEKKPASRPSATSRPTPTSRPTTKKATQAPITTPAQKRMAAWLYHLQAWTEFIPYQQVTNACADRYTAKQALKNLNTLQAAKKSEMLRHTRRILKIAALSFRAIGDSKVSALLTVGADSIRLCQWSAFFAAAYLKFHSTNAKRAFWKQTLISNQGFTLGLITAFSYRFARNLMEDVGKIIVAAQKVGHYGMVVAAWLLGKKYTGLTNMFCGWKRAKTLCKVVGTVVKIGYGTYTVLKSGYRISAKGVVLTVRYSKKLYYSVKSIYYYFKARPKKGKIYCRKLARAGTFFRGEGVSLAPKDWAPKVCQPIPAMKPVKRR